MAEPIVIECHPTNETEVVDRFVERSDVMVRCNRYVDEGKLWVRNRDGVVALTLPVEDLVA